MLKLLTITLLFVSGVKASQDKLVEEFLKESFSNNPAIIKIDVVINEKIQIPDMQGWEAYIIKVDATVKAKPKNRQITQKMIWFSDGKVITKELTNFRTGESLKDLVSPSFKAYQYKKENLIYGNANAKHKVAVFSDPLCPFCGTFVPAAIKEMKKRPNTFAIYYFHFPLPALHPAAVEIAKAAIAAELKGHKDVTLRMYDIDINPKERDVVKILKAFNKTMKTSITPSDIRSFDVIKHYESDQEIAQDLMVSGTPTMFFDDKIDMSKRKYQKVQ